MTERAGQGTPTPNAGGSLRGPAEAPTVLVVRASVAPLHAESRVSSPQVSQRLAGHPVTLLARDGDWLRVRGEDGYEGWMHEGYVRTPADARSISAKRLLSLGCEVRDATTGTSRVLPLGAWVSAGESVVAGEAVNSASRARTFQREARSIAATAVERFAGTPYQWGGVTPWGADCSGFVQTVYWLHGIPLPRDAWQQSDAAADAGKTIARVEPADLLFFSDRPDLRITHVGISLGASYMVHVALGRGGFAIERLDDSKDAYVSSLGERFVGARRVL